MASIDNYAQATVPAEGSYVARLVQRIDLGLMPTKFGVSHQARCAFELCEPTRKADKPVIVYKSIWNLSLRSPNFRDLIKAISNRAEISGMDLKELIGLEKFGG